MKEYLIHSRTCVYNINYHVVWSVKYRRKILSAEIEIYLKELVQKIASDKGFTVHLFKVGEGDHIHCFASAPPKLSVTDIVKYLKGTLKITQECEKKSADVNKDGEINSADLLSIVKYLKGSIKIEV